MNYSELKDRLDVFRMSELPRLRRLAAYFAGNHAILSEDKDPSKPQNRLVNNFCKSITDSTVGYFMGIPVTYAADPDTLSALLQICADNDESFVNSSLARDLSIYGRACELFWCDSGIRFTSVSPETMFPIFSEDVCESLEGAVRTFRKRDGTVTVQYMDKDGIYDFTEKSGVLMPVSETEHFFGTVPANFYRNNREMTGDFESVISLVDAYNKLQSECINDFDLFADSYLAISGMGGTTAEDMEKIRRDRVLLLDDGGEAKWLTKTVNDQYIENLKCRIAADIYRFSGTADISEVESAAYASGIAMRYRLINFENRVAVTEQFFRRGLMRRFGIIGGLCEVLGRHFDHRSIKAVFTRNLPGNFEAAADLASKLDGIVSKQTVLELLPFVDNADAEMARISEESREVVNE